MEQYEANWKDYYKIFGISPDAEAEVIKAAYTALARKYHPDTGGDNARMKSINEAYEVLSDPARKAQYDRFYGRRNCSQGRREESHQNNARSYSQQRRDPQPHRDVVDERGILPWPSWKWQLVALLCSFPLSFGLIYLSHDIWIMISGCALLLAAGYAAVRTRCLKFTRGASLSVKLAGGSAITASLGVFGLASVIIVLAMLLVGAAVFMIATLIKQIL